MKVFKFRWLIVAAVQILALQAHANLDVTCILEDCLAEGWQSLDQRNGDSTLAVCRDGDCNTNGWQNEFKERPVTQIYCKRDGCFNEGWTVEDVRTGNVVADVSCQTSFASSDCLQFGWTTYETGRGSYVTRCVNGDCRNIGWDVRVPGYAPQAVRCKTGGCFTTGWTVYR